MGHCTQPQDGKEDPSPQPQAQGSGAGLDRKPLVGSEGSGPGFGRKLLVGKQNSSFSAYNCSGASTTAGSEGFPRAPAGLFEKLIARINTFANFCRHG